MNHATKSSTYNASPPSSPPSRVSSASRSVRFPDGCVNLLASGNRIPRICREFEAMALSVASTLAVPCTACHANSKLRSPVLGAPFHQLPLQPSCIASGASSCHASGRRPLLVAAVNGGSSSESVVEDEKPSTSSSAEKDQKRRMRMWGNIAWWIVVCYSVPFSLYTMPFIYGDFEIYKHLTVNALRENYHLAGLHIANHLPTWQIHAAAALLFMAIGPFQFNTSFRNKYPVMHKRLGYTFALCTIITAVTGATTMRDASELGPIAVGMVPFMSAGTLIALAISINAARNKNFQSHRRWMLRSAAIGYSVMYTRMLPVFIQVFFKVSTDEALDYGFPLSVALNSGLVEIYIQMYLSQHDKKGSFKQATENTVTDRSTKVS